MIDISEIKQNIDLVSVMESAGVELKRSGTRHVGLCPFHAEKTPSFFVFRDNHFKCFGCGEHGDCIDFVQKMYGLSFPDALKYLGIEQGEPTPETRRKIERRKHRAELVRQFRDWEQWYGMEISDLWHKTKRLMMKGIPTEDLELYAPLFHMLPVWEHHRDILINGNDIEKFKLYKEAQDERFQLSG
ncbi:MAG: CHC2 zinc finger domain-containing protein [Desulfobacterales bacterium]|jgi:DNA primase